MGAAVCCPCCFKDGSLKEESKPLLINEIGPSGGTAREATQIPTVRVTEKPVEAKPPQLLPPPRLLAPHELTAVRFEVVAYTKHGETLHVSGDSAALGSYDPQGSIELFTSPELYPIWHTEDGTSTVIKKIFTVIDIAVSAYCCLKRLP
jgi:hypothetical protein